ncbi:MAG: hypothetical protein H3C47_00750 [Candidatus Cloacimonetes bacterium]|nr:hypothetical protein [Candidatus Cloacimonadota bacterium]
MKKNQVLLCLFLFVLGATFSTSLLLNRQALRDQGTQDLTQQVRQELSSFLSSYLWHKVDIYGHFGKWIEVKQGDKVDYMSIFKDQLEFVPLTRASISLDASFLGRVAVLANTMAVSMGRDEEALALLKSTIIEQSSHQAIFRLYGEVGLIQYQVKKDCTVALRYLEKAMHLSKRLPLSEYSSEDVFNQRFYGLAGASCSFEKGDIQKAFRFHQWSFFEPGNEEFEAVMKPLRDQIPEESRPKPPVISSLQEHVHDEFCDHGPEASISRNESVNEALERQARETKEHFFYMIPSLHPLFFTIDWPIACILLVLMVVQALYLIRGCRI